MTKSDDKKIIIFILITFALSRMLMYLTFYHVTGEWAFSTFLDRINIFDTAWYHHYVDSILEGSLYMDEASGQAVWAFFPLYPLLVAGACKITGMAISMKMIGCLISSLAFLCSQFVAYKYIVLTRKSIKIAYIYIAFMSLGIYTFYFSIMYTESLFLLLLTLSFYFLRKEEYIKMGISGMLLSATRNVGIMFVFVVLCYCVKRFWIHQTEGASSVSAEEKGLKHTVDVWEKVKEFVITNLSNEKLVLGTCMIPMGLFLYMLFLHYALGDGLAFVHVQRAWGRINYGTWHAVKEAVISTFPPDYLGLMFMGFFILIVVAVINNKNYEEMIFAFIVMILATSSNLQSIPRYMIGCFVVVLAFADELEKRSNITKILVFVLSMLAEYVLMREWLHYNLLIC